jgi:hypothetical protein
LKRIICKKCNTINFADANFCRKCRNSLLSEPEKIENSDNKIKNDDFKLSAPIGGPIWSFQLFLSDFWKKNDEKYDKYLNKFKFLKNILYATFIVQNIYKEFIFDKENNKKAFLYICLYVFNFLIGYVLSLGFNHNFLLIALLLSLTEAAIIAAKIFVLKFLTYILIKVSFPSDLFLRLICITSAPLFLSFVPYSWEILKIYLIITLAIGIRDTTNCSTFKSFSISIIISFVDMIVWGTFSPIIHSLKL